MDAYKEDTFEKMHGRIRDQLFTQNSHARSRDTAIAFAEMEVLNHILKGGFFSEMKKNGENMFVLAFLEALYRFSMYILFRQLLNFLY